MTDQVIFDRGYRKYEGERSGPAGARKAVYKDGLRRIVGLGRKARYKIFPWSLISIAIIAAAVFVGIHWAIGDIAESIGQEARPTEACSTSTPQSRCSSSRLPDHNFSYRTGLKVSSPSTSRGH